MSNITYQIRLPDHLRDDFLSACKENGLTGSSVLKQFMLDYISRDTKPSGKNSYRKRVRDTTRKSVETSVPKPIYVPPDVFDIDYLRQQQSQGKFYYYDADLVRHSVSESEYWDVANSNLSSIHNGKEDYWSTLDKNELNYNISIGEPDRPRLRHLYLDSIKSDTPMVSSLVKPVTFKVQNSVRTKVKKNKKRKR